MLKIKIMDKFKRSGKRPLIDKNYNVLQEEGYNQAHDLHTDLLATSTFNTNVDQRTQSLKKISPQQLAEFLQVDGSFNSMQTGWSRSLIERSVSQHFPKPPEDLNTNLQQHLEKVKETVSTEIVRLHPLLEHMELTGCLTDCYHRQAFDHLHDLLQNISSPGTSFKLLDWTLRQHLSRDFFDLPDLPGLEPLKKVDPLLFSDWVLQAKEKVVEIVQTYVKMSLKNILQNERNQAGSDTQEAYVTLYIDTIKCIDPIPKEAQTISQQLSNHLEEVCFKELLSFLERYTAEQSEALSKEAKKDKPNMWHFLKTLNSCNQIKQYVQNKDTTIKESILQETVATLEKMERFTSQLWLKVVSDLAEKHLKNYFKSDNKHFVLNRALKELFPKTRCSDEIRKTDCFQDILKIVMDDAYKLIADLYLTRLLQRSQSKLRRSWSPEVAQTVTEDAELLHNAIAELAPGVQQWNLTLFKVGDLLARSDIEAVKLVAATWSKEDPDLPKLLRWTGLPGWQVQEVLYAIPGQRPGESVSCFSGLKCW